MQIYLNKLPIYPEDNRQLRQILAQTDHWERHAEDLIEAADIVDALGTDNYLTRTYVSKTETTADGEPVAVDFHAAYYTGMIDPVPHVPERCFVAGGWQLAAQSEVLELPLDGSAWLPMETDGEEPLYLIRVSNANRDYPGRRIPLPRGVTPDAGPRMRITSFTDEQNRPIHSGYFFIANGGTVARSEDVRLLAFKLTDDYAYYLKVQITSTQVDSAEQLARVSADLLQDLMPEIMLCVPDWTKVRLERDDRKKRVESDS
jgi:hypothetical protein